MHESGSEVFSEVGAYSEPQLPDEDLPLANLFLVICVILFFLVMKRKREEREKKKRIQNERGMFLPEVYSAVREGRKEK